MTKKTAFFEGCSWFKFNNLGLALRTNLKFYASLSKGLKLKVKKFWELILTFVEVTGEKLVRGTFLPSRPSWIGLRKNQAALINREKCKKVLNHGCTIWQRTSQNLPNINIQRFLGWTQETSRKKQKLY